MPVRTSTELPVSPDARCVAGRGSPPLRLSCVVGRVPQVTDESTEIGDAQAALDEARARLLEVPAEVVVTNHVMGLYELAAIHLSAAPPNIDAARLAIDAIAALVEGLGDRLGDETATMHAALANMRMAFVEVTRTVDAT